MAKRAYGVEDKKARRAAILDAARRLFMDSEGDFPSAASIAEAAGLAKGTLYLYFRTKEAIYADLLLEGWTQVLRDLEDAFEQGHGRAEKVAGFIARYTTYLDDHPELLRLDALGHRIEGNLDQEAFHAFKRNLTARLASGGAVMEQALVLPPMRGVQLLMRTYALTRGLWLSLGDDADPGVDYGGIGRTDFKSELTEALAEYWRGALTSPSL